MREDLVVCPYCEAINRKGSKYCRKCGARIPAASSKDIAQILLSASLNLANSRYAEAERECRWVIENDPFNADAHSILGDILERKGELPSAIEEYKEAVRLAPNERFFRARLEELSRKKAHKAPPLKHFLLWLISLSFLIFLLYRLLSLIITQGSN